jgi:hypothetical protein
LSKCKSGGLRVGPDSSGFNGGENILTFWTAAPAMETAASYIGSAIQNCVTRKVEQMKTVNYYFYIFTTLETGNASMIFKGTYIRRKIFK